MILTSPSHDIRFCHVLNNNRLYGAMCHYIGQGQAYTYDDVNRLIRFDEGHLVCGVIPNPIDTEVHKENTSVF